MDAEREAGNIDNCNKILKAIETLSKLMPDLIDTQIEASTDFPNSIVDYIKEADIKKLSGIAVTLLCRFYDEKQFEMYSEDDTFITMIMDTIVNIKSDNCLIELVMIAVKISYNIEDPMDNVVFMIIETHKNQRYFGEILLHVLNLERDIERTKMQLFFIRDYGLFAERFLFYKNDTRILIDILMRLLGVHIFSEDPGNLILEVLDSVTDSSVFAKEPVRIKEIDDLWYEVSDDPDLPTSNYDILHGIAILKVS